MHGPGGRLAPGPFADFPPDRRSVGTISQPDQRQKHKQLELADHGCEVVFYLFHFVKYIAPTQPIIRLR